MEKRQLYFIAVIPPPEVCRLVMVFKQDMQDRFGSQAAMRIVPHITLKAPFKLPAADEANLCQWFQCLPVPGKSFVVSIDGFGAFPKMHSPVLFLKPVLSPELAELQRSLINAFQVHFPDLPVNETEINFHPHITIAYRDLQPDQFQKAWAEYRDREFSTTFYADRIHLLRHDGERWELIQTIDFQ